MEDPVIGYDGILNYDNLPQAVAVDIINPMIEALTLKEFEGKKEM